MEQDETKQDETLDLTEDDFNEFLAATGEAQWKILLAHAERNNKTIQIRRLQTMEQHAINQEEIAKQFEEFCHTKGIAAKFKVAFANIAENTRKQKEADKAQLEEVKRRSAENNPEFTELLHTKGFKAKVKLIIENIKKGAKESNKKVRKQIEQSKHGVPHVSPAAYSVETLTREFNAFLKAKGLDDKYAVEITDKKETE
ncbi:MAG: hypothetical protein HDT28_04420 [Clostridiales bacterium]|nr:hypothetical protein [Clostridiales bacterium]